MDPSNGNEAVLTKMHQAPAVDAREQSIDSASNNSQDADPVTLVPYHPSTLWLNNTCAVKPKDKKTSTSKPLLQQATSGRPTTGHTDVKNKQENLMLCQIFYSNFRMYLKNINQLQLRPPAQAPAPVQVTLQTVRAFADTVHNCKVSGSVQVPAQVFCKDTSPQEECRWVEFFVCIQIFFEHCTQNVSLVLPFERKLNILKPIFDFKKPMTQRKHPRN